MKKDYSKLRGRIIEKFGSYGKFAEFFGTSSTLISMKLTGVRGITMNDVITWSEALDITTEEIGSYFFA